MRKNQQGAWTYDYYLKDHLGNIRAVLATENSSVITEEATIELTVRMLEEAGFENISTTEYDKPYLYPYDPNDPTNAKVSKLNAQQGKVIGPSKVMAVKRSELLDVSTQYWYQEEPGETVIDDLSEIMAGVLLNLTGAGIGVIPSGPEQGLALLAPMGINNVSGTQYDALETFITNSFDGVDLETTGAHLVYMFFNKQMQLDPTMSGRIAVGDANTLGQIAQQSMRMPDDGFFYVYTTTLSARSYYFDKLKIRRWKPEVRVKYDYYPYGMLWENPDLQDEESRLHDHAYQDKEFMFGEYDGTVGLALYDFHARMYDPATGRWLVPDPAAQFANPYLAMGNNPQKFVDPDGQWVQTVAGAIVGGVVNLGLEAIQGNVTDFKSAAIAFGKGALIGALAANGVWGSYGGIYAGIIGATTSNSAFNAMPSVEVQSGDYTFNLSPSVAFGTHGLGVGLNLGVTYDDGNGFSFGINAGLTAWSSHPITQTSMLEGKLGAGAYLHKNGIYSNQFFGGNITQRVGGYQFYLGKGQYINYENDWAFDVPFTKGKDGIKTPIPTGDNGDRWRTTGFRFSDADYGVSFGLNLATGSPVDYKAVDQTGGLNGTYSRPEADMYRLGAVYLGIGNYRFGFDSERVRHSIQNVIIHNKVSGSPWFRVLNDHINPYIMFQTSNPYTTW